MKFWFSIFLLLIPFKAQAEQFSTQPHGLIGAKRTFVDAWFFNLQEGSGLIARGANNTADLLSGPAWVTGLHGNALSFAAANSRAEIRNETNFDFMTLTSTWTLIVVYKAQKLLAGIIFSKTNTFSATGFYLQAESDATGDIALVINSGTGAKWVTPVIPLSRAAGGRWHVLIMDYHSHGTDGIASSNVDNAVLSTVKFSLDGVMLNRTTTFAGGIYEGPIANDNLAVISGWDLGTSTSFNGTIDMVGIWRGEGKGQLSDGDHRMIATRILGR